MSLARSLIWQLIHVVFARTSARLADCTLPGFTATRRLEAVPHATFTWSRMKLLTTAEA